ncbi:MAG TPA: hypothetical protein VHM70_18425 [Polyangiaceae bacterium]|jgi:MFS family permease|nr:hypothetical protein [Polyangiaceae bacterium]
MTSTSANFANGTIDDTLRKEISGRRDSVRRVLDTLMLARRRLSMVSTVGSALAATATTGPALGGKTFTAWLADLLGLQAPAWQVLCGLAAICSLSATIAVQFSRSRKLDERVVQAQMVYAKLERLHVGLALGESDEAHARKEYLASLEEIATLEAS